MGAVESQEQLPVAEEQVSYPPAADNEPKLVPVAESIRYRKRAQSAEQEAETLAEQLTEEKTRAEKLSEELAGLRCDQELTRKLAGAGVLDMEAALLIARARVQDQQETDIDEVIEQLRAEKQYLFAENDRPTAAKKTAGPRERLVGSMATIERAAKKAAKTGDRTDLQEYLRARRNFL